MGIVYVVYDDILREAFAAKTFQDEIFARDPTIAQRFTQEALIWVNLDAHQNIAQARFVQAIEGKPYLFLEYVSGGDLGGWIGTLRLTGDLPQVLRFAIHFCDGMTYALSKGIKAHRDIKPQNCLITEDGTLKVTDFGLAKGFDEAIVADTETTEVENLGLCLTRVGMGMGTPPYTAPEQFDDAKHVDVRADIYSFGVMLYQMLTGRLPFAGGTWEEYKRLHKTQQPPTLGTQDLTLKAVIEACLAKDPAHRFANFGAVREKLTEIYERLTGETAREPLIGEELDAVGWSNKGMSLCELGRSEEAIECYDFALQINPRLAEVWSNKGNAVFSLGRSEEAIECCDRALEINPRFAQAWSNKGNALVSWGCSEEAIACQDRALEINRRFAEAWSNKGNALLSLGRSEEAIECCDRALEINHRFAQAWSNKGNALGSLGRSQEAIACHDRALEINPRFAEAWTNKGVELSSLGRSQEAIACHDRALEINPCIAEAWTNKGNALGELGCSEEAIECCDRALEINPRYEKAWYNKGVELFSLGSLEEAIECCDRALEINPRLVGAWRNKGVALGSLGNLDGAIEHFDRALEINSRDSEVWGNKGIALVTLGRSEEAVECCDRALEINQRYAEVWYNKGAALANGFQNYHNALACFEEAQRLGFSQAAQAITYCRQMLRK